MKNLFRFLFAGVLFVITICGIQCFAAEITLVPESECYPFAIFQKDEGVNYEVNGVDAGTYSISDYYGNVTNGSFANGRISIRNLQNGHYYLMAEANGETLTTEFSVVPNLCDRRNSEKNPLAFSAMASYTYTCSNISENYDAYAKTIALAGVHYVREFSNWQQIENHTGRHAKRIDNLIDTYNRNNIGVMFMFQAMPGSVDKSSLYYEHGNEITTDMDIAYNAGKKWQNCMTVK